MSRDRLRASLLLLSLVALIFFLAWGGDLQLPTAVLLGAPLGAFLWLCWQFRRHGMAGMPIAAVALHRGLPRLVSPASNEIVVLGAGTAVVAMLLVALLAQVGIEGLTPPVLGVSLLVGWTLALMSSPITVAMLILSRFTGVSSLRIGYRWNGLFLCLAMPLLAAWFLVARF